MSDILLTTLILYGVIYTFAVHRVITMSFEAIDYVCSRIEKGTKELVMTSDNADVTNAYKYVLRNMEEFISDLRSSVVRSTLLSQVWLCPVVLALCVLDEDMFAESYILEFKKTIFLVLDEELEEIGTEIRNGMEDFSQFVDLDELGK